MNAPRAARYERSLGMLLHEPGQGLTDCKSTLLNLSEKGFCLETAAVLPPGRKFTFDLTLPNGFPVAGMAECRWERVTPGAPLRRYGAEILLMDPVSQQAFGQYLASLSENQPLAYRAASSRRDREQAYGLLHDNYVAMGYMKAHPSRIRFTPYHAAAGSATFVAALAETVVATMSVFADGRMGLPIDQIYKREVDALRAAGRKVVEFGALAHRRANMRRGLDVFLNLCRLAHAYAAAHGVDDILITVNPRHRDLYPKLLRFKSFGGERNYPALADNPAVAYRLDLRQTDPKSQDWSWFFDHPTYRTALKQAVPAMSSEDADYFLELTRNPVTY